MAPGGEFKGKNIYKVCVSRSKGALVASRELYWTNALRHRYGGGTLFPSLSWSRNVGSAEHRVRRNHAPVVCLPEPGGRLGANGGAIASSAPSFFVFPRQVLCRSLSFIFFPLSLADMRGFLYVRVPHRHVPPSTLCRFLRFLRPSPHFINLLSATAARPSEPLPPAPALSGRIVRSTQGEKGTFPGLSKK